MRVDRIPPAHCSYVVSPAIELIAPPSAVFVKRALVEQRTRGMQGESSRRQDTDWFRLGPESPATLLFPSPSAANREALLFDFFRTRKIQRLVESALPRHAMTPVRFIAGKSMVCMIL
jgi:hypothetical protein